MERTVSCACGEVSQVPEVSPTWQDRSQAMLQHFDLISLEPAFGGEDDEPFRSHIFLSVSQGKGVFGCGPSSASSMGDAHCKLALSGCHAQGLEYAEQLRLSGLLNDEDADEEAANASDYVEFLHVYRHWTLDPTRLSCLHSSRVLTPRSCAVSARKVLNLPPTERSLVRGLAKRLAFSLTRQDSWLRSRLPTYFACSFALLLHVSASGQSKRQLRKTRSFLFQLPCSSGICGQGIGTSRRLHWGLPWDGLTWCNSWRAQSSAVST